MQKYDQSSRTQWLRQFFKAILRARPQSGEAPRNRLHRLPTLFLSTPLTHFDNLIMIRFYGLSIDRNMKLPTWQVQSTDGGTLESTKKMLSDAVFARWRGRAIHQKILPM